MRSSSLIVFLALTSAIGGCAIATPQRVARSRAHQNYQCPMEKVRVLCEVGGSSIEYTYGLNVCGKLRFFTYHRVRRHRQWWGEAFEIAPGTPDYVAKDRYCRQLLAAARAAAGTRPEKKQ